MSTTKTLTVLNSLAGQTPGLYKIDSQPLYIIFLISQYKFKQRTTAKRLVYYIVFSFLKTQTYLSDVLKRCCSRGVQRGLTLSEFVKQNVQYLRKCGHELDHGRDGARY